MWRVRDLCGAGAVAAWPAIDSSRIPNPLRQSPDTFSFDESPRRLCAETHRLLIAHISDHAKSASLLSLKRALSGWTQTVLRAALNDKVPWH